MKHHRRLLFTAAVVVGALTLIGVALSQFAVDTTLRHWYSGAKGYQAALQLQKTTHKPVALYFHTDWCENCKRLREKVLASPKVAQYFHNAIPVKINPEIGLKERQIADSYGVRGYPTFFMVTGNPKTVKRIRTPHNLSPQQFIDQCEQITQAADAGRHLQGNRR
ncbi:MAG: thioredoxin fold domain-containing protein [Gammaproteobacteria bacterium]|jgi:thiol:disulfide interchange protein